MQSRFNYMNPEQLDLVIQHIPDLGIRKWYDRDIAQLFKNLYWLALRPVEGIMLKKEDFNLSEKEVYLGKTKTRKQDFAAIPPPYIPELSRYLSTKKPDRLLPGLTYKTFYPWLKRLGEICDIPAWTTPASETGEKTVGHIFRKSLGKDMEIGTHGKKFKYPVISKQLRHKKVSTTIDSYLKLGIESVKEEWEF